MDDLERVAAGLAVTGVGPVADASRAGVQPMDPTTQHWRQSGGIWRDREFLVKFCGLDAEHGPVIRRPTRLGGSEKYASSRCETKTGTLSVVGRACEAVHYGVVPSASRGNRRRERENRSAAMAGTRAAAADGRRTIKHSASPYGYKWFGDIESQTAPVDAKNTSDGTSLCSGLYMA